MPSAPWSRTRPRTRSHDEGGADGLRGVAGRHGDMAAADAEAPERRRDPWHRLCSRLGFARWGSMTDALNRNEPPIVSEVGVTMAARARDEVAAPASESRAD